MATARFLRLHGFITSVFSSAEEFLLSPRVDDTACLITDVKMPGMNGVELQHHLIARGKRVPIIFITAFPEAGSQAKALAAGAAGFLTKPFSGKSLVDCVNDALKAACATRD